MATTSFDQKFTVANEKIEEFFSVMYAPEKENPVKFNSRFLTGKELQDFVQEVVIKND